MSDTGDLIATIDAARILEVSRDMVRWLTRTGRLRAVIRLPSGQRLYSRQAVIELAEARRQQERRDPISA